MEGINIVTSERILRSVANVAQAKTTSFDVVGQKPLSRIVKFVCDLIALMMLQVMDTARNVDASLPSSKMVSRPPVVGVSVLLRRRSRIVIVTCTIASSPENRS